MSNNSKLTIGDAASDFLLNDTSGMEWRLNTNLGRVVTLLFYPGDETMVCTKQMCSVRDNWAKYLDTGAEVIAISPGTSEDHKRFASRHSLPMRILADTDREVTNTYGKHWCLPIWATRAVIVIDAKGFIRYRNVMVRALRPTDEDVLSAIHLAKYNALTQDRFRIGNIIN